MISVVTSHGCGGLLVNVPHRFIGEKGFASIKPDCASNYGTTCVFATEPVVQLIGFELRSEAMRSFKFTFVYAKVFILWSLCHRKHDILSPLLQVFQYDCRFIYWVGHDKL